MSELYVLGSGGQASGPFSRDVLARAIVEGTMARDVLVAPAGGQWLHASQVPEVLAAIDALTRASSAPPAKPASSIAPKPAPAPALAPAPAPAKPDDKPKPKPLPKWLGLAVFGAFAAIALVECGVAAALAPSAPAPAHAPAKK